MHKNSVHSEDRVISTQGRTLDHAAGVYDLLSPLMLFCQEKRISEKAIRLLSLSVGNKILDVGCGTGTVAMKIAKGLDYKSESLVVGLDAAPRMIDVARKKTKSLKNIRFDTGIAEQLPYKDCTFDAVISTFFFHHINFELKKKALQEIWRVIKRDGAVVIVDIDTPTNIFGRLCAWCAYLIFRQEEIRENIQGKLMKLFAESKFRSWHIASRHLGCISVFKLVK